MLNSIVDGICDKLTEAFGADYQVYSEQVKQGLQEPCFLISCVNPTSSAFLGTRQLRTNLFSVVYFPRLTPNWKTECYDVQDALYDALEIIAVDGLTQRGTGMDGQIVDETLVFTVNYDMFVDSVPAEDIRMETLENNGTTAQ